MPLPEKWDGIFYSKETHGDMIFDLSPEQFVGDLADHRGDAPFLVAGACFDLLWNGEAERCDKLVEIARKRWTNELWSAITVLVAVGHEMLATGVEREIVGHVISNVVGGFFTGGVRLYVVSTVDSRLKDRN